MPSNDNRSESATAVKPVLDESDEKISVVLPAFNEAGNVEPLLAKIHKVFERLQLQGEVVLINDGSTDGTSSIARQCVSRYPYLRVYDHLKNMGLTKALSRGFEEAEGNIIIFLCADLQSDPEEDIPKLLEGIAKGADVVVGWRQGRRETKRFGSKIYNLISRILFDVKVHDQNWIKAFRKDFVEDLILRSDWHRFMVALAEHKGFKVVEVKTNWYPRTYGQTKFGFMRIPIAISDMLVLKAEMMFIEKPMRFFGSMGAVSFILGMGIIMTLLVLKHCFHILLTEYTRLQYFLLSILLLLAGFGLSALGILGEFMASNFEKVFKHHKKEKR
ncbi:glycosyltransferase family 2 protein [Verrucomicrobiota bacterium]